MGWCLGTTIGDDGVGDGDGIVAGDGSAQDVSRFLCGTWAPAILRIVPDMDSEIQSLRFQ